MLFFNLHSSPGLCNEPVLLSGKASALLRDDVARTEQIIHLIDKARSSAMERVFGKVMVVDEQLYVQSNKDDNRNEVLKKHYTRESQVWSGGIWLEDEHEPEITEVSTAGRGVEITVKVCGYALPAMQSKTPVHFAIRNCASASCSSRIFREGESVFFEFTAGSNGFLMLVLEDPLDNRAYFIQSAQALPIKIVKEDPVYLPKPDDNNNLVLTLNELKSNQRQYVWFIYSCRAIDPPSISPGDDAIPIINASLFRRWIRKSLLKDTELQFVLTPITVLPNLIDE